MTVKDLEDFQSLVRQSEQIYEELERIRVRIEHPTIAQITGMPKGSPKLHDEIIAVFMDKEEMYKELLLDIQDRQMRIEERLSEMTDETSKELLRLRYIMQYSWGRIGKTMGYERTQVWRKKKKAIKEFTKV